MIQNKNDLKEYLACDKRQLGITRKIPRPFTDEIWKYEIVLRKYEYYLNTRGFFRKIMCIWYKLKWHRSCVKLGIFIGPNTCEEGLSITHINCIQINHHARVGKNLRIQEGVCIGGSGKGVPTLGNNIYLGSGCKVIGDITIADDVVVGAGAVVVNDILEKGITVAGVPAKKISNNNSEKYINFYKYR